MIIGREILILRWTGRLTSGGGAITGGDRSGCAAEGVTPSRREAIARTRVVVDGRMTTSFVHSKPRHLPITAKRPGPFPRTVEEITAGQGPRAGVIPPLW